MQISTFEQFYNIEQNLKLKLNKMVNYGQLDYRIKRFYLIVNLEISIIDYRGVSNHLTKKTRDDNGMIRIYSGQL